MVRTGGPRGHGSGRAKSPEAERERRAKIRTAVSLRRRMVHVRIIASYRLRRRSTNVSGGRQPERFAWNYQVGREYLTFVPESAVDDPSELEEILNDRFGQGRRIHYNVRVEEL